MGGKPHRSVLTSTLFTTATRHARAYGQRARWRLTRRKTLNDVKDFRGGHLDPEENASSTPPAGERIEWPGFWVGELYGPSHAPALIEGLEKLGSAGGGLFTNSDIGDWVRDARSWTGGFHEVGTFSRDSIFPHSKSVDLPEEFAFINANVRQIAPGITVLVAQFALGERGRSALDEIMRNSFDSTIRPGPHHNGYSIETPPVRKAVEIGKTRTEYRTVAREWLGRYVPGLFARKEHNLAQPTWDFLLTQNEQLFTDDSFPIEGWKGALGLAGSTTRWSSDALPGLELVHPRDSERSKAAVSLVGLEEDALRLLEGQHSGNDVRGLTHYLYRHLADLFSLWTMKRALGTYEKRFTDIRDELAKPPSGHRTAHHLRQLRREVLPLAFDLATLRHASQDTTALRMPVRYSGVDFQAVPVRRGDRPPMRRTEKTLFEWLQDGIRTQGKTVARQGQEITDGLRLQGELLLAATNVRLQWLVLALTLLVGIAGVYATMTGT